MDAETARSGMNPMSASGGGTTAVEPAPPKATPTPDRSPPRVRRMPPWRVLLHNDETNDMDHVVASLQMIASHNRLQAEVCMMEAHRHGVSLVTVTHREHAELLEERFRSRKLVVTIEPESSPAG